MKSYIEKVRKKYRSKECQELVNCYFILRKELFIVLSIVLGVFNSGCAINDLVQVKELRQPWMSTQGFTTELLLSNTFGFYFGIIGYVYSMLKKSRWKYIAVFSIVWNFILLILRMAFEIVYINFRPESFGSG